MMKNNNSCVVLLVIGFFVLAILVWISEHVNIHGLAASITRDLLPLAALYIIPRLFLALPLAILLALVFVLRGLLRRKTT